MAKNAKVEPRKFAGHWLSNRLQEAGYPVVWFVNAEDAEDDEDVTASAFIVDDNPFMDPLLSGCASVWVEYDPSSTLPISICAARFTSRNRQTSEYGVGGYTEEDFLNTEFKCEIAEAAKHVKARVSGPLFDLKLLLAIETEESCREDWLEAKKRVRELALKYAPAIANSKEDGKVIPIRSVVPIGR